MEGNVLINVDEVISSLTKMLIEQDLEDKNKNKETYIKKTTLLKEMIRMFRQYS